MERREQPVNGWRCGLIAAGLLGLCVAGWAALEQRGRSVEPPPPRNWDRYQVIMWSTGEPREMTRWIERLREMGCTSEECYRGRDPGPFVRGGFGFYVENLVPELAYLHNRRKLYDEDSQGYTTTRDRRFLVRRPCFDDPAFWAEVQPRLQALVRPYVPHAPLLYNLQDELSIGSFASPSDYCFGPHTLAAFRQWLREQYGTLDALNREWETRFGSWEQVMPMTTYEVKARERETLAAGGRENYASWSDHRAFMDLTFSRTLARLRGFIREIDGATPVGIEGTQMPSTWGGYDLWRLSQSIDWIEPYDIDNSRELFRSFLPRTAPVLGTVFGDDFPRIQRRLWWLLLHGDRGCLIWDDEKSRCIDKSSAEMPLTERGRGLAPIFAELKAVAPRLFPLEPIHDRIAIHYSQASIRAHWMIESRPDGDTWPRRLSSYEAVHSRFARVRDSFVRVVEDLGLQYNFVSYEQVESGELRRGGYKVLLLPQSVAMSAQECRQIEAFVRAGGTVIADAMAATMDPHCRRLAKGQLDALFGIRRTTNDERPTTTERRRTAPADGRGSPIPLRASEPEVAVTTGKARGAVGGVPMGIEHRVGKGRALYLNVDMHDYGKYRLTPPAGKAYADLFRRNLSEAGIRAPIMVLGADGGAAACVEVWRYRGEGTETVAVMRNPEFDAESLRAIGYPDNAALEKSERVQVVLPKRYQVTDVRSGRVIGTTARVTVVLDAWRPVILELRPVRATDARKSQR